MSTAPSEGLTSPPPASEKEIPSAQPAAKSVYPPYPSFVAKSAPPSVADAIKAGRGLRRQHKSSPPMPVHPLPRPARPKTPKATDVKQSRRVMRLQNRCLRRHGFVLTDRMERMAKPPRRRIIYLWREQADRLPAETIARLRSMLDADEPFKPDQAYAYFINMRKTKKNAKKNRCTAQTKKDVHAICGDKRFLWARNATVAFARGVQQRLARGGCCFLQDGMLKLSDIILDEICGFMKMRTPSRRSTNPKAKFMMEMSDKVAVWIDGILSESDDRMLMMDFDEDDDLFFTNDKYADDFLDMMGGGGLLLQPKPAYLKFTGEMLEAFIILTDSMSAKGKDQLLSHGKFQQTYAEGANELKEAPDFEATEFNTTLANQLNKDLTETARPNTPAKIEPFMKSMVDICANYLAQVAEFNKDKGPAFKALIKAMKAKGGAALYQKGKAKRSYGTGATELEKAKGLESNHDDPELTQEIHGKLTSLMATATPPELKDEMPGTLDLCSKYLSERAIDEIERGPAFDFLIKKLEQQGGKDFTPEFLPVATQYSAAYTLKSAPGFGSVKPEPKTAPRFIEVLHREVDAETPANLKTDMNDVIDRCGNYLSAFVRDRDRALEVVLKTMKSNPSKEMSKRNNYALTYGTGALETETAPVLVPYLHVKDISDEHNEKLTVDVVPHTTSDLKIAVKSAVTDVSKHLSQPAAVRSGAAGERYPLSLLGKILESLGDKPLFKHKAYGQTYADGAEVLKYAGKLESDPKAENLKHEISSEMKKGVPSRTAKTIADSMHNTIEEAAQHLAKTGYAKGEALDHLVTNMKAQGDTHLEKLQGYDQSYKDGARRIEITDSLANTKVDKGAYESVRNKLTALDAKSPNPEHAAIMPEVIDDASKFLAAPFPETDADKRRILRDLMARQGEKELAKDGTFKIDYTEGGKEIMAAPVGVHTAQDPQSKKDIEAKIHETVPDEKLKSLLKIPASEGAAHIADIMKGRGEAMEAIKKGLKNNGNAEFLKVGNFDKTYAGAGDMLDAAPKFGGERPNGVLLDKVSQRVEDVDKPQVSALGQKHMGSAMNMASNYIANVATKECGLDAKQLADWDASGAGDMKGRGKGGVGAGGIGGEGGMGKDGVGGLGKDGAGGLGRDGVGGIGRDGVGGLGRDGAGGLGKDGAGGLGRDGAGGIGRDGAGGLGKDGAGGLGRDGAGGLGRDGAGGFGKDGEGMDWEEARRRAIAEGRGKEFDEAHGRGGKDGRGKAGEGDDTRRGGVGGRGAGAPGSYADPEYEQAMGILRRQLQSKGQEMLYQQPLTALTHAQAADWLEKSPKMRVGRGVKDSSDTARLHQKFERKLSDLVSSVTPAAVKDTMQDVVIESSRILSEYFNAANYKALVRNALIAEMQKHGNEILLDEKVTIETSFFAAQRLKKAVNLETNEGPTKLSHRLRKKMEDIVKCRSLARKLTDSMKDHIQESADYLSTVVLTPDEQIEAYVALLAEMDEMDDAILIDGNIPKSYKDSAKYLRSLTTFVDEIGRPNAALQSTIEGKLNAIMANVPPRGYTPAILRTVITDSTRLLVSYIMLQGERTNALNVIVSQLDSEPDGLLLRHGALRKPNSEGAELLRGKNTDQMSTVVGADPVVSRKVQIKLTNLMRGNIPDQYTTIMEDVISDATRYLAVELLKPHVIKVCKCMKSVFVQCELWCDEILRRVARPCCTCTRNVSAQALADLPGEVTLRPCPASSRPRDPNTPCPAAKPCERDPTTSYMLYSTEYNRHSQYVVNPTRLPRSASETTRMSCEYCTPSAHVLSSPPFKDTPGSSSSPLLFFTPLGSSKESNEDSPCISDWNSPARGGGQTSICIKDGHDGLEMPPETDSTHRRSPDPESRSKHSPVVATDQMADWHSMMVSLTWNVQAWRNWIQETIDRALSSHDAEPNESWFAFRRRIVTESLQWRQYNLFSRQLTLRLALRYRDKKIVSPTRATIKTPVYMECQKEMLDIINMFNRWTQWLSLVVKETDSLEVQPDVEATLDNMRWNYFRSKVHQYAEDWLKYNMHLKICWEHQYMTLIKDWMPSWSQQGPVWVMSAYGAVPSGAVRAGCVDGEPTWVARTTHRRRVLPAALRPSRHCCLLHADGAVHHYAKYQVMCNAKVSWVAWRAGAVGARAVRVAPGVHAGRVLYRGAHLLGAVHAPRFRCHVVIFDRPFAFNCYELLVLDDE